MNSRIEEYPYRPSECRIGKTIPLSIGFRYSLLLAKVQLPVQLLPALKETPIKLNSMTSSTLRFFFTLAALTLLHMAAGNPVVNQRCNRQKCCKLTFRILIFKVVHIVILFIVRSEAIGPSVVERTTALTNFEWGAFGDSWTSGVAYSAATVYRKTDFSFCHRTTEAWGAQMEADTTWMKEP